MRDKKALLPYIVVGIIFIVIIIGLIIKYQPPKQRIIDIDAAKYVQIINEYELNEAQQLLFEAVKQDLAQDPNDLEAILELANLFYYVEEYDLAEEVYIQVLRYEPQNTIALQNLANTYRNTERYDLAEKYLYILLSYNNLWIPAYEILGELYRFELVERDDKFVETLNKAREADFQDQYEQPLLKLIAFYYKYKEDNTNAIKYFAEYIEKYPDDTAIKKVYDELKNQ